MIPIITGVIASSMSTAPVVVYNFVMYVDCEGTTSYSAYTTSPVLTEGVELFANEDLTNPFFDAYGTFATFEGLVFIGSGATIGSIYNQIGPTTVYAGCNSDQVAGSIYYTGSLEVSPPTTIYYSCYDDPGNKAASQIFFIDTNADGIGDTSVTTDANGEVNSITPCGS